MRERNSTFSSEIRITSSPFPAIMRRCGFSRFRPLHKPTAETGNTNLKHLIVLTVHMLKGCGVVCVCVVFTKKLQEQESKGKEI